MAAHDQRFKTMLREFFPDLLMVMIPERAHAIDCTELAWQQQEYFLDPPTGRNVLMDMVAEVKLTQSALGQPAGPCLAIVNVEIEAEDRATDLRATLFRYWNALRERRQLPVLSLAVYLRVGLNGTGFDVYEETILGMPQLRFEFPYLGLPALDAFDYLRGENLLAVALTALMRCPEPRKAELKAEALQRVATAPINDARRYLLAECIQAYLPLHPPQIQEFEHLLTTQPYREARTMTENSFLLAVEQAEKRGQIHTLRRQLQQKFGPLRQSHLNRLDQMTTEQLDALAEVILTAGTLSELGLDE